MKFEDFLMEARKERHRRLVLVEEVENLQDELDREEALNRILRLSLRGPALLHPCDSSIIPPQVQVLLTELILVEKEIVSLEKKVKELKLSLHDQRKQTRKWEIQLKRNMQLQHKNPTSLDDSEQKCRPQNYNEFRKGKMIRDRSKASLGSASEIQSLYCARSKAEDIHTKAIKYDDGRNQSHGHFGGISGTEKPNELSEELIKCLIGIFLELNQGPQSKEGPTTVPKLNLSCINSKGFMGRTSFTCKAIPFSNATTSSSDPYGILPDLDGAIRDIGSYKNFTQITRNLLHIGHLSQCARALEKLRVLMHKLCTVDLTILSYKQKLAFWINTYNAFLQHGLPSSHEKLLALMNKAVLNVGGLVLNALAIEHFILRHPSESRYGPTDEKEMLLRHAYGLGYPEPNVTFALCRGSWSSPALRVYTPDEVTNVLERAKVEYLEASVGVTTRRKILVPKLLQWHMQDFADDMESLIEWIYSQLPRSGSLKRLLMECLNREMKFPIKMVEIQPYESEFRYLIPQ